MSWIGSQYTVSLTGNRDRGDDNKHDGDYNKK